MIVKYDNTGLLICHGSSTTGSSTIRGEFRNFDEGIQERNGDVQTGHF
jgi:hypothetical protein